MSTHPNVDTLISLKTPDDRPAGTKVTEGPRLIICPDILFISQEFV